MKAIVVKRIGAFTIEDVPTPEPREGEVLIETAVTGLCRTDLKIIEVGHRDLVLPRIPGEEIVGEIVKIGPGVSTDELGKRVYVYPGTCCGTCKACFQGAGNLCHSMKIMGFHRDGGFADFVIAPVQNTIPIPDGCDYDQAVTAEPLSCCLNALERAALKPHETIGIWGGGPAGAFLSRAAAAMNAEVTVFEPHTQRQKYHSRVFSSPGDVNFDVAVVAVGAAKPYQEALAHLHPRGRLVVFSGMAREENIQAVDFNSMHYGEKTIIGAYGCGFHHGVKAIELIHTKKVEVSDLISHRMPLRELGTALDHVRNKTGMKILLYPKMG